MLRRFYCRCWHRWGGLPSLLPAYPAFSLLCCPHPPSPLPRLGRGRLKVYFAGGFAPGTPALNRLRHLQTLPEQVYGGGLTFFAACLPCLWFTFLPPIPPTPFPGGEGGEYYFISPGATAPGTPALNRLRHLQLLPSRHPAQGACGSPQKRQEAVPYEQCRQPRRGGTGGEELRRLRWSSPPGQRQASAAEGHTPRLFTRFLPESHVCFWFGS